MVARILWRRSRIPFNPNLSISSSNPPIPSSLNKISDSLIVMEMLVADPWRKALKLNSFITLMSSNPACVAGKVPLIAALGKRFSRDNFKLSVIFRGCLERREKISSRRFSLIRVISDRIDRSSERDSLLVPERPIALSIRYPMAIKSCATPSWSSRAMRALSSSISSKQVGDLLCELLVNYVALDRKFCC